MSVNKIKRITYLTSEMAERRQKSRTSNGAVKITRKKGYQLGTENVSPKGLRRKGNQCKAMIKVDIDKEIIRKVNLHTHAPSQMQVEVAKVKANIKRKAQTTTDTLQQILGAELRNISQEAAANIPSTSTLRRNRKLRKDNDFPHIPVAGEDIPVLHEQYQNTVARQPFLIYDSGVGDQQRMFLFALE